MLTGIDRGAALTGDGRKWRVTGRNQGSFATCLVLDRVSCQGRVEATTSDRLNHVPLLLGGAYRRCERWPRATTPRSIGMPPSASVTGGVDTHLDLSVAAAVDRWQRPRGAHQACCTFRPYLGCTPLTDTAALMGWHAAITPSGRS